MRIARLTVLGILMAAACDRAGKPVPANRTPAVGSSITITTTPADPEFGVHGFADGGALPAISADGALVAARFHDETDFVGLPIDTVVVWRVADGARVGAVASNAGDPPTDDQARQADPDATDRAARATTLLARARWIRATSAATVAARDDGEGADVVLPDGRTLRFRDEVFALDGATVTPASFDAPGSAMSEDGAGDGCGTIGGVEVLAGGPGWLLVVPDRVNLGGDDCYGGLSADLAQVIRF